VPSSARPRRPVADPADPPAETDRRTRLVEATIAVIAESGYRGATVGAVARRAGVSAGLVAFHFGDKDGLLAATLLHLVAGLHRAHLDRLAAAATPRARVDAVVDALLGDVQFERATAQVWLAFWSEVPTTPRFARLQRLYARRTRSNLAAAFAAVAPRGAALRLAEATAALIDGCWLRATLAETTDGAAERALVAAFLDTQFALLALPLLGGSPA
jgi:transcriptional repressor BetI